MRTEAEIKREIDDIKNEMKITDPSNPNYGHLMTISIGLCGELEDIKIGG